MRFLPALAALGALVCHAADDPTFNFCYAPVTETAVKYVGTPYVRAGEKPEHGFDCSGFTRYVFEESCGFELPRSSRDQSRTGVKVPKSDLLPGDLVVFREPRRLHMGLYLGEGQFIHSPNRRGKVRVESLESGHFSRAFREGRRIVGPVDLVEEPEEGTPAVSKAPENKKAAVRHTTAKTKTKQAHHAATKKRTKSSQTASRKPAQTKKTAGKQQAKAPQTAKSLRGAKPLTRAQY